MAEKKLEVGTTIPAAVQLDLFEGNSIVVLRTRFSGNLSVEDGDIGIVKMGDKVRLVIEGRVRNVTHSLDKDERAQRVQTILVDRVITDGSPVQARDDWS